MSNEIKAVSFRLGEEDVQKFREIADEQGLNQAEMFQSLMNSFEMAKAKGMITDRAKEIEVFQETVNSLVNMFINSLAINQTSEERIRETLSLELNTKDKTIADLQQYKENVKEKAKEDEEKIKELEITLRDLTSSLEKNIKELEQKSNIIANQQEQINTLNSIVTEYKQYKDINKELEIKNNELNSNLTDVLHSNSDLKSKMENLESMKEFYKAEVESLKAESKELNKNIKDMEKANKSEIKALKKELTDKFNEELISKLEIEKVKYQLELDKISNREQLFMFSCFYYLIKIISENLCY